MTPDHDPACKSLESERAELAKWEEALRAWEKYEPNISTNRIIEQANAMASALHSTLRSLAAQDQKPVAWHLKLADDLERLCCAETEGKFYDLVTDSIQTILEALRRSPPPAAGWNEAIEAAMSVSRDMRDKYSSPTGDQYTQGLWDQSQRIIGKIAALRHNAPPDTGAGKSGNTNPINLFTDNVDQWGALEWFDRLAKAVRGRDGAVLAKDAGLYEIYNNVASSSATRLVRDYEHIVRPAIVGHNAGGSVPDHGGADAGVRENPNVDQTAALLSILEPEVRESGPILVCDNNHNDVAEFFHNEHATVPQSYEAALAYARSLVSSYAETHASAEALLREALENIAADHDCGCKPCMGQCKSQESLRIIVDDMRDIAREALSHQPAPVAANASAEQWATDLPDGSVSFDAYAGWSRDQLKDRCLELIGRIEQLEEAANASAELEDARAEASDSLRTLDEIAEYVGCPHNEELTVDHVRAHYAKLEDAAQRQGVEDANRNARAEVRLREALDLLQLQQRGRAQALRLLDAERKRSFPETLARADTYEECGNELNEILLSHPRAGDCDKQGER